MYQDHSGRGAKPWQMTLAGLVLLTVIAVLLTLLGLRYTGRFEDAMPVRATLTSTGDGLPERADVKFRGMIVGAVNAVEVVAAGQRQTVDIHLKPGLGDDIPDTVTARVIPNNIFGVTAIELVDNGPAPGKLTAGAEIPEDTSEGTVQLQTTLNVLRDVLEKVQPERLGRVLATLSAALEPDARVPGSTIERLDKWITEIHHVEGIGEMLGDLGRATIALNESAPELVGVLSDSVTTARTLTERREQLVALLADTGGAVDTVNGLFARNPDAAKELVPGLDTLFGSLAQDPDAIPAAVANLNSTLQELSTVFNWGPTRQMVWSLDVSFTPFKQYTAADCPHYGELAGPRCGGPTVPEVAPEQQYPPALAPGWLDSAGPKPGLPQLPALPGIPGLGTPTPQPGAAAQPGLPALPGLPAIPGLTAPLFPLPPGAPAPAAPAADAGAADAADPGATPAKQPIAQQRLRGRAAMVALLGREPTAAEFMFLTPVLAGGTLEVREDAA